MSRKTKKVNNSARALISNLDMSPSLKFKVEEAYKSIRANISFSIMKKGCKNIVVTSSIAGEGKTTTTINLAITFAQAGQRVLLLDGDLRKPKIHHYFSIPNSPGLTDYLGSTVSSVKKDKVDLFSVVHPTEYENLSVICSGTIPPNPAELLGSEPMEDFLKEVERDYDYIIIDTPPINIVSDALPLIRESDGVVLIVRYNQSTHPEVERAIASLEFIDAKILGFVVNFVETKSGGKYKYGNYGKYGRYGRYGGYGYGYGYGPYGYGYGYGYNYYNNYGGYGPSSPQGPDPMGPRR
ncbi:MAG: CpsD/CapB family tyrosine-protein kinase [Eubacterium sp.]|nr:CpsD/CapB family tyrosine-protein kinase [Eubacterium sp.]